MNAVVKKLVIKARKLALTEANKAYISRRAAFAFSRYGEAINALVVMLTDVNGPKGGQDKQCKVMVRITGQKDIVVTDKQGEIHHAINRAITRASYALKQRIRRKTQRLNKITSKHRTRAIATDEERLDDFDYSNYFAHN